MPRSSHPLNLLSAWILFSVALPCAIVGVVGALAETGTMRLVLGLLGLSGLAMMGGAVQMVVAWRRATRRETAHEAALYAAARGAVGSPAAAGLPTAAEPGVEAAPIRAAPALAAAPPVAASADGEVLAHWRYADDEWSEYTRRELHFRKGEALWVALGVVLLGMLVLVFERDASYGLAFGISAGIGAIFYLGRRLQARAAHAANGATRGGEVIISPRAVLLNGRYHVLEDDRFHFAGVRLLDEDDPPVLEFTVTWATRSGRADEQVYVPVPRGREGEARALAASFPGRPATAGNRG